MKYYVRLCRPRFEIAFLEIEAEDDDIAEELAFCEADDDDDQSDVQWKLQGFDPEEYRPHIEACVPDSEVSALAEGEPAERSSYLSDMAEPSGFKEIRYLLLFADTATGDGRVLFQPWFPAGQPELLEHDLCSDWLRQLSEIHEEGLANFEEFATAEAETELPDTQRPIVVPPPGSKPRLRLVEEDEQAEELPDPRQYRTEIRELLARPFTKKEHDAVLACLQAIDPVLSKSQTVMMRVELAAVLLAAACSAAFDSAAAHGRPKDGWKLYSAFERIAVKRARELYEQKRA